MYWEQTAVVKTDTGLTEECKITKGVRQRCVLSESLFNLYTDEIFREIDNANSVVIGGTNINNSRYADDTALMATTAADLQKFTAKINEKGKPYGMGTNLEKTKIMAVCKKNPVPNVNVLIDGTPIEQVTNMVYLGYMVTDDGISNKEIKRRIEIARNVYKNLSTMLSSRDTSIDMSKRIVKYYMWATFLYGSEMWTITRSIAKKINAFELWIYRRMLRAPWTAHKVNSEISTMLGDRQQLLTIIKQKTSSIFWEYYSKRWTTKITG